MEFAALMVMLLVVIWIQNTVYRRYALKHLEYRCWFVDDELMEGEETEFIEEICNRKFLPLPWCKTEITAAKWLDFAETQSIVTDQTRYVSSYFVLKSYHKIMRRWKVRCTRRGDYTVRNVVVVASDLLGNVTVSRSVPSAATVVVLPKPAEVERILPDLRHLNGDQIVRRHLISDPFYIAGTRPYADGDSARKINWNATAAQDRLMVFENEFTTGQNLAIILNMHSREFEGRQIADMAVVDGCVRICAACLADALSENIPVRLLANGVSNAELEQARREGNQKEQYPGIVSNESVGDAHVMNLMYMLAELGEESSQYFSDFLRRQGAALHATQIVVVTAYLSQDMLDFAWEKQQAGVPVKIAVLGNIPPELAGQDCVVSLVDWYHQFNRRDEETVFAETGEEAAS